MVMVLFNRQKSLLELVLGVLYGCLLVCSLELYPVIDQSAENEQTRQEQSFSTESAGSAQSLNQDILKEQAASRLPDTLPDASSSTLNEGSPANSNLTVTISSNTSETGASEASMTQVELRQELQQEIGGYREGITQIYSSFGENITPLQLQEKQALDALLTAAEQFLNPLNQEKIAAILKVVEAYGKLEAEIDRPTVYEEYRKPDTDIQTLFDAVYNDLQQLAKTKLDSTLAPTLSALSETLKTRAEQQNITVLPTQEQFVTVLVSLLDADRVFDELSLKSTLTLEEKQKAAAEYSDITAKLDAYGSALNNPNYAQTLADYREDFERRKNTIQEKFNTVLMGSKSIKTTQEAAAVLEKTIEQSKVALIEELKTVLDAKKASVKRSFDSALDVATTIRNKIGQALQQFWQQNITGGTQILNSVVAGLQTLKELITGITKDTTIPAAAQETLTNLYYATASAALTAVTTIAGGISLQSNPVVTSMYTQTTEILNDAKAQATSVKRQPKS